jgi:hypothetical protein
MKPLVHAGFVAAICACVTACAGREESSIATAATPPIPIEKAGDVIAIGKSTKADVIVALGKTTVVSFDSGYEVWVYRYQAGAPVGSAHGLHGKTEFVVLFAPSGVVTKTRVRTAPPANPAKG